MLGVCWPGACIHCIFNLKPQLSRLERATSGLNAEGRASLGDPRHKLGPQIDWMGFGGPLGCPLWIAY